MSKKTSAFVGLLLAAAMIALAIFAAGVGFGWFTSSSKASATGMSVSAKGDLEIRAVRGGKNIAVMQPSADMEHFGGADLTGVRPGESGNFTFYVYDSGRTEFSFSYVLTVTNNAFFKGDTDKGFYAGITETMREKALGHINAHLLFFREKSESGTYSGWIPGGQPEQVTAAMQEQAVTVYWVWVPWYSDIFTAGGPLIAAEDRAKIAAYYGEEAHKAEMFDSGEVSEDGYNKADYIIGTTLKHICFDLTVQEE